MADPNNNLGYSSSEAMLQARLYQQGAPPLQNSNLKRKRDGSGFERKNSLQHAFGTSAPPCPVVRRRIEVE
jgi:hypothetical protein